MRSFVAALGLLAISASPALAQSPKPCSPHRMRNFVAFGAGIGAAVAVTGGCRECALIGAPVGAIWGRVIAEGTSSKCSNDPAKSGAASGQRAWHLAAAIARHTKDRKSTRLNSSHLSVSRMPSSA